MMIKNRKVAAIIQYISYLGRKTVSPQNRCAQIQAVINTWCTRSSGSCSLRRVSLHIDGLLEVGLEEQCFQQQAQQVQVQELEASVVCCETESKTYQLQLSKEEAVGAVGGGQFAWPLTPRQGI
jgi:hypothetical protein